MFDNFVFKLKERIQEDADSKKEGVDYLVDIIGQDLPAFQMAFDPLGEISEKELPKKLYSSFKSLLRILDESYITPFGTIHDEESSKKIFFPAIELDYAKFEKDCLVLTEKGKRIINEYREIRGYSSLEDERINNLGHIT